MPQYFDRFINTVADVEVSQAFEDSIRRLGQFDKTLLTKLGGKIYAPGKWTVKGFIQHVTDFERIFAYRVLLFTRREGSIPQDVDPDRFETVKLLELPHFWCKEENCCKILLKGILIG